ncbi:M66 family metalloprotease [Diaphorobacter caeni]|uniref:M66 family metalloprotease n=1 Tax=Diaphorobacter caeni TaxID=2784387 RepID=UPI00188EDA28|nr:M66 family metalloprotease [Diaphorobacter caeni]MBF5006190.1 ricin-type beta-trefoil lectin domain protein [Diaphorobacter caeni]
MNSSRMQRLSVLLLSVAALCACGGGSSSNGNNAWTDPTTPAPSPNPDIGEGGTGGVWPGTGNGSDSGSDGGSDNGGGSGSDNGNGNGTDNGSGNGSNPGDGNGSGTGSGDGTDTGTGTTPAPSPSPSPSPSPAPSPAPTPAPAPSPEPAPEPSPSPSPAPAPTPAPAPYAEPTGALIPPLSAKAFYDTDSTGKTRTVRNDLGGSLPGMVQFAQSHTVDPSGNEAKEMPRLTMSREAMVLITPDPSLAGITSMQVTVSLNGATMGTLTLRHPDAIFRSDYAGSDNRPDYVYSRRAWTGVLPWQWVQPGMELRVADNQSRTGSLLANAIDFGGAGELVVQSVRLGMLTTPPVSDSDHWFRTHPQDAATDYFQTAPLSKLTAAYYEDVTLPKVMVATGVIYDNKSAGTGGWYEGDMRENTAKSTFSVGINMSNYGVTSSSMVSQNQPQAIQTVTIHHARGVYTNGTMPHGYSGGNSILTLASSQGNEFSHEIGHHYGLGHYPGQSGDNYFWSAHHHDSGWGFIGHRKRMRTGIQWRESVSWGLSGTPKLDATYPFAPDAMAGGSFSSSLSRYTHYTGYSTKRAIQPALSTKAVPDKDAASGYRMWNASTRTMEDKAPTVPTNQPQVWYNAAKTFSKPRLYGVPVITILGGYDPQTNNALLYAPLRGNWGNVFHLPSTSNMTAEPRNCWLDVSFAAGNTQRIAVAGKRMNTERVFNANKLHVNLAQADKPSKAVLQCQTPGSVIDTLYTLDIPQYTTTMPAPAIVGKEYGYSALRAIELPTLDAALQALSGKNVLTLSANDRVLLDSYRDNAGELSAIARTQLQRYDDQQTVGQRLNRWINTYSKDLNNGVPEAQTALVSFVRQLGFAESPLIPAAQSMKMAKGYCIQKFGDGVRVAGTALCTGSTDDQWVLDARGAIHSRSDLGLCLTDQGGNGSQVALTACDATKDSQAWTVKDNRYSRGGRCLDLNQGFLTSDNTNKLITYNCSGGANQFWGGLLASNSLLLTLLSNENIALLEAAELATKRATVKRY